MLKNNNKKSSNSLVFSRWPQTKIPLRDIRTISIRETSSDVEVTEQKKSRDSDKKFKRTLRLSKKLA